MRILLIGASGFIGSHLRPFLENEGHKVAVLKRNSTSWNPLQGILDPTALVGFDAIINLAGEAVLGLGWTKAKKQRIYASRVEVTKLLVDTIMTQQEKPKLFMCASATGIYGSQGAVELTEESKSGTGFLADVCTKWEREAQRLAAHNVRTVILRFGIVLGQDGGIVKDLTLPFKLGLGGKIGPGSQWMSWIALQDALRAVSFLLQSSLSGPVNIVSPHPVTNVEFTKALAKKFKRPAFCHVPAWLLKLFDKEMAEELFLASAYVLPSRLTKAGFHFLFPKLTQELL